MTYSIALLAAFGSAICFGTGAVLAQIGARREAPATDLDPRIMLDMAGQLPYVGGMVIDFFGWVLSLIAVRALPLFLVQGVVASSIGVTVIAARIMLHTKLKPRDRQSLLLIGLGLVLLAASASSQPAAPAEFAFKVVLSVCPFIIAVFGGLLMRHKNHTKAAVGIAVLSGLGFSGTAVCGRILVLPHNMFALLADPVAWALLAYGFIGMLLFTIALQRTSVTTINAVAFAVETLVPAAIGVAFLGDRALSGRWPVMAAGMVFVVYSTYRLAQGSSHIITHHKLRPKPQSI